MHYLIIAIVPYRVGVRIRAEMRIIARETLPRLELTALPTSRSMANDAGRPGAGHGCNAFAVDRVQCLRERGTIGKECIIPYG
jgi:hypothetical protein